MVHAGQLYVGLKQERPFVQAGESFAVDALVADIDGKVDGLDYLTWAGNFGKSEDAIWFDGDFVHDGTVDGLDYLAWASNYGTNTNASVVPEPGTFALAGIAALLIAALRRRR